MTFAIAIALPVLLFVGCEPADEEVSPAGRGIEISTNAALGSLNGLKTVNGLKTSNGLSLTSGLSQSDGLSPSSELMSTADGRRQVEYLVRCALPANRTLVRYDNRGNRYNFSGLVGLAPEWENGACGQSCQEWITACMLSLLNTTGVHVPVWMMADNPAVGFGQNADYPEQEGAFFGNLFRTDPVAYYCAGRDYFVDPVAGRIGSPQVDSTYTDIYGRNGPCAGHCIGSDFPYKGDGYKACSGWKRVITIWRQ